MYKKLKLKSVLRLDTSPLSNIHKEIFGLESSKKFGQGYPDVICFFSTQPQCCLTFSRIELQMLLSCCLIHISITLLKHYLYLLFVCSFLDVGLFLSYLSDLFVIFIFIFIIINRAISWIKTRLIFPSTLECSISFGW